MDKSTSNDLYDLVSDFDVAMLVTYGSDGIHARPMTIARLDVEMHAAYLLTDVNSVKIDEIHANPHALLTFQAPGKFASVSGELAVIHDRALVEAMWKEAWKLWFPGGMTDPSLALLKFAAHEGEFWDNTGMKALKFVYSSAKAYIAGKRPEVDKERHSKVTLK